MKIYNKITMDMSSFEVLEEDYFDYSGELALLGGGGPSGAVDFPDYMEDIHVNWLTGGAKGSPAPALTLSVEDVMNTALAAGGNPYTGESAFDPNASLTLASGSPLKKMQDRFDTADAVVTSLDPRTDYGNFVDKAKTKVDEAYVTETEITNYVSAYESLLRTRRLTEIARFTSGMADLNAVHSSQFIIGLALIEDGISREVNQFERELRLRLKERRGMLIDSAVKDMVQLLSLEVGSNINMSQIQAEIERLTIVAKKEQVDRDLELDVLDATWDLTVFQYGANLLAAISGAAHPVPQQLSKVQSAIGGTLSGAATGAMVGSIVPGIGTAVGAGVGAAIGLIGGLFS